MRPRVALAYSGGLDTTVAIKWLSETKGLDVVAVAVDVGQGGDSAILEKKALEAGASEAIVIDAADRFASNFVAKALDANALYQQKYPLISALSRPLICEVLVETARGLNCELLAHGCTGKGNDQVRFEVSLAALAPDLEVLAPIRDWGLSRDEAIAYGLKHHLPINPGPAGKYSIDENMWGRTIECGILEDPWAEPPDDVWERTVSISETPHEVRQLEIGFERGRPVLVDGEQQPFSDLVATVDRVAGSYGFGRIDIIEDRVVGIKSREVYEAPGALALIMAHSDLEELTLDRDLLRAKRRLEQTYANLVYEGLWFSPLREAIDAFVSETAQYVNGSVRIRLERGTARVAGRRSPNSLYDDDLATYGNSDAFDHSAAAGFVKLWGLPSRIWGKRHRTTK